MPYPHRINITQCETLFGSHLVHLIAMSSLRMGRSQMVVEEVGEANDENATATGLSAAIDSVCPKRPKRSRAGARGQAQKADNAKTQALASKKSKARKAPLRRKDITTSENGKASKKAKQSRGATPRAKGSDVQENDAVEMNPTSPQTNIAEKHYKDLMRLVERIKKMDEYGFFVTSQEAHATEPIAESLVLEVNDIVEVLEIVEKNFHRAPGVARVTAAHDDGTFDVCFILDNRTDTHVPTAHMKRSDMLNRTGGRNRQRSSSMSQDESNGCSTAEKKIGDRVTNLEELHAKVMQRQYAALNQIDWVSFEADFKRICDKAMAVASPSRQPGTLYREAQRLLASGMDATEKTKDRHTKEFEGITRQNLVEMTEERMRERNQEAAVQGDWRTTAFSGRVIDRITEYVPVEGTACFFWDYKLIPFPPLVRPERRRSCRCDATAANRAQWDAELQLQLQCKADRYRR